MQPLDSGKWENTITFNNFPYDYLIWPGDTNYDGFVDENDIDAIAIYFRDVGEARNSVSFEWNGNDVPENWVEPEASFADCNGDGEVNITDVLALCLNWEKTHATSGNLISFTDDEFLDNKDNSIWVANRCSDTWMYLNWRDSLGWHKERVDSVSSGSAMTLTSFGIVRDRNGYLHISYSKSLNGIDDNRMWYATTNGLIGVEEEFKDKEIYVPSIVCGSVLRLRVPEGIERIRMYDIAGREVKGEHIKSGMGKIDVSGLTSGVYFLRLSDRIYRVTIIR